MNNDNFSALAMAIEVVSLIVGFALDLYSLQLSKNNNAFAQLLN